MTRRTQTEIALDQKIGRNLKILRTFIGMSQKEMGGLLNVTAQNYQKYEIGRPIPVSKLCCLMEYMHKKGFDIFKLDYFVRNALENHFLSNTISSNEKK